MKFIDRISIGPCTRLKIKTGRGPRPSPFHLALRRQVRAKKSITLQSITEMAVPKMSQLRSGVGVNIILKADQPTGKLTSGCIADILTRGDHPRGIKVRLQNGNIGRVQSLSSSTIGLRGTASNQPSPDLPRTFLPHQQVGGSVRSGRGHFKMQDDYRNDSTPSESLSLEDYIKPAKQKRKRHTGAATAEPSDSSEQNQALLESEFPNIDTALVAAMLIEYPTVCEARRILQALS